MANMNNNQNCYIQNGTTEADKQRHIHELLGSTDIAEPQEDPHNHRFATVSGEEIQVGNDHYHEIIFKTDFHGDHFHVFCGKTSGMIQVGNSHVHFVESETTENDGHTHKFRVATLIVH